MTGIISQFSQKFIESKFFQLMQGTPRRGILGSTSNTYNGDSSIVNIKPINYSIFRLFNGQKDSYQTIEISSNIPLAAEIWDLTNSEVVSQNLNVLETNKIQINYSHKSDHLYAILAWSNNNKVVNFDANIISNIDRYSPTAIDLIEIKKDNYSSLELGLLNKSKRIVGQWTIGSLQQEKANNNKPLYIDRYYIDTPQERSIITATLSRSLSEGILGITIKSPDGMLVYGDSINNDLHGIIGFPDHSTQYSVSTGLNIQTPMLGKYVIEVSSTIPDKYELIVDLNTYNSIVNTKTYHYIDQPTDSVNGSATYEIILSDSFVSEGSNISFTVNITNANKEVVLFYRIEGNIDKDDFQENVLSGEISVDDFGRAKVNQRILLSPDLITEKGESFNISIYSDGSYSKLLAKSKNITIYDTSNSSLITENYYWGHLKLVDNLIGFNGSSYLKSISYYLDQACNDEERRFIDDAFSRLDSLLGINFIKSNSSQQAIISISPNLEYNGEKISSVKEFYDDGNFKSLTSFNNTNTNPWLANGRSWEVKPIDLLSYKGITNKTALSILMGIGSALYLSSYGESVSNNSVMNTFQLSNDASSSTPFFSSADILALQKIWGAVDGTNRERYEISVNDKIDYYNGSIELTQIYEGDSFEITVQTQGVDPGTKLYYYFSNNKEYVDDSLAHELNNFNITGYDFIGGKRSGEGVVGSNGIATFSFALARDMLSEGSSSSLELTSQSEPSHEVAYIHLFRDEFFKSSIGGHERIWFMDSNESPESKITATKLINNLLGYFPNIDLDVLLDKTPRNQFEVIASTWKEKVYFTYLNSSGTFDSKKINGRQIDFAAGEVAGSVISGGKGNDDIKGFAGWDIIDGGDGNDLIHGGNGRDIISGGAGRDELHGDFGWNTFKSEKDGVSDLIAVKSDHYLANWLYGKAGNSPNGEKSDIIEGLDPVDKIKIIGVDTSEITFAANISAKGVTGIGIYGKGILEALYTGGDLTVAQITQMTSGDASAAAMSNSVNSYGIW